MTSLPRRITAALVALFAAVTVVLATAVPAAAHDELSATDPEADSTVAEMPAEITLSFSGDILDEVGATEIRVADADGADLTDGDPVISGMEVTQPLVESAATGEIAVQWRVVSSDGHPISGEFAFTVEGAASPTPTSDPTATSTPTASATPTEEPSTPSPTATTDPAADETAAVPWVILGIVLVAVLAAVAYLVISRARSRSRAGTDPRDDR